MPRGVPFTVTLAKLHRDFTHSPEPEDEGPWRSLATAWRAGVEPLRRRDLLAAVLVQFPVSFQEGQAIAKNLTRFCQAVPLHSELFL